MNIKKSLFAGALALGGLSASAVPTVEITKVEQPSPGNGVVNCTYKISGLDGREFDFVLKVAAQDAQKGEVSTNLVYESLTADETKTLTLDCKQLLGKAYPNVTFYGTLENAVQLWEGGPYWAKSNVGAKKSTDAGYYFWWGDTEGFVRNAANDGWVSTQNGRSIQFSSSNAIASSTYGKSTNELANAGVIDASGNLTKAYDAARANLGGDWRMPTSAEVEALIANTTRSWVSSGVKGYRICGKDKYAARSIFIPAVGGGSGSDLYDSGSSGHGWSSTPDLGNANNAWNLYFNSGDFYRGSDDRFYGFTVRPVR